MNTDQLIEGIGKAVAAATTASDSSSGIGLTLNVMSAFGTVAAVVVALYFSGKGDSIREKKEKRLGRAHSLYLLPILEGFHDDLRTTSAYAYFADHENDSPEEVQELLTRAKQWAVDFERHSALEALSAQSLLLLPEVPSLRISYALGELHSIRIAISRFDPSHYANSSKTIVTKAQEWAFARSRASDFLGTALDALRESAGLSKITPSPIEIHGEP